MTKSQAQELYTAYAGLEAAAEQFYQAADRMSQLVPSLKQALDEACEDLNFAVVQADTELDEVL
jgi:hypothetical protein